MIVLSFCFIITTLFIICLLYIPDSSSFNDNNNNNDDGSSSSNILVAVSPTLLLKRQQQQQQQKQDDNNNNNNSKNRKDYNEVVITKSIRRQHRIEDELLVQLQKHRVEQFGERNNNGKIVINNNNNNNSNNFNYDIPVTITDQNIPDPHVVVNSNNNTNNMIIVLILSARENFKRRNAIRETWGGSNHNYNNNTPIIYFIIGGPSSSSKVDKNETTKLLLIKEQNVYNDIMDSIHPDSYKTLPHKLRYGIQWIIKNYNKNNVKWILKVDDDMYVRQHILNNNEFLQDLNNNNEEAIVIGNIIRNQPVQRHGKWAEGLYTKPIYPPWPKGSCGYIISYTIAKYIATDYNLLRTYQGEDTSLGIWLSSEHFNNNNNNNITWINVPNYFVNHGNCMMITRNNSTNNGTTVVDYKNLPVVIGHRITPVQMQRCYKDEQKVLMEQINNNNQVHIFPSLKTFWKQQSESSETTISYYDKKQQKEEEDTKKSAEYKVAIERDNWDHKVINRIVETEQRNAIRAKKRQQKRVDKRREG